MWRKCLLLQCLKMYQVVFFIIIMQVAFEKVLVEFLHGSVLAVSVCDLYLPSFTLMLVCLCAHAHVSCLKPQLYSQFLVLVIKGV